jgi:hypothetical protein
VLASTVALSSCLLRGKSVEASIEIGREYCNSYEMPRGWHFPGGRTEPSYPEVLEFKSLPARPRQVCASQRLQFKKLIATEMLCFSGSQSEVVPTDTKWEAGRLLAVRRTENRRAFRPEYQQLRNEFRGDTFSYLGRTYRKRGDEWYFEPNHTTDHRYIILQSEDNDNLLERKSNLGIFGPAEGNFNSPVYIQVFDLTTGRELIMIQYDLSGMSTGTVLSNTGWLDDRTVLSMQTYSNKIIVCRLP